MGLEFHHIPVLFDEVMEGLNIHPDGIYVDGTCGGGSHALGIARRLNENGRLIAFDQDQEAVNKTRDVLAGFSQRVRVIKGNYAETKKILEAFNIENIDGMLLDLGVSSHQFDDPLRGFSYRNDARLDMRMDKSKTHSAFDVVNEYSEESLYRIIRDYGEEAFAGNIAKHICMAREKKPLETTLELVDIIKASIPARMRKGKAHPAKKTFQALRIEVNDELRILEESIDPLIDILKNHGRLAIISFHSLEDRIVKQAFKKAEDPCICPKDFPVCVCGRESKGHRVTKKAIVPSLSEVNKNPRSHSAHLRIFERIED